VAGHSRRVADLARKLAIRLQLPAREQQDIFVAALLHDIGKIGFSDSLLARPVARMNGEETGIYRRHPVAGEAALMPLAELKEAACIIRSHHERFDGQGYPDGLQGAFIPLGARILAVANDYDGLQIGTLSDKRLTPDDARETLARSRGKRYDPQVLDAFFELIGGPVPELVSERTVSPAQLTPGMVLARDFFTRDGVLLLAADYILDPLLVKQIQLMAHRDGCDKTLHVRTDRR
jgi:response regulator RpfG family c-di-GMP phosphodiesterase